MSQELLRLQRGKIGALKGTGVIYAELRCPHVAEHCPYPMMLFGNDDDSLHKLAQRFRIDSDLRVPTDLFVFTITSAPRKKDILRRSGDVDVMYTGHIYCNRDRKSVV